MKKLKILLLIVMLVTIGIFSGCTSTNENNGSKTSNVPSISFLATTKTDINDFTTHIDNNTFAQGDKIYVYCEISNMIHNGGYDLSLHYRVEKAGNIYDETTDDFTGTSTSNLLKNSWYFYTDEDWSAGDYAVYIDIVDKVTSESYNQVKFISILNKPTAYASSDKSQGALPLTVKFTGSGYDTDGTIVSYSWNFKDGQTSTQQNPSHTFNTEGTYSVTLKVTDNDGLSGEDSVTITVFGKHFTFTPTDDVSIGMISTGTAYDITGDSPGMAVEFDEPLYDWQEIQYQTIYIKFDLSDIPSGSTVSSAKLRLYCYLGDCRDIRVHRFSNVDWSEEFSWTGYQTLYDWAYEPPYPSDYSDSVDVDPGFGGGWYEWDVKNYVQSSLSVDKITLVLDSHDSNVIGQSAYFNSKDKGENIPQLVVDIN